MRRSLCIPMLVLLAMVPVKALAQFSTGSGFNPNSSASDFLPVTRAFQANLVRQSGQWTLHWTLEPGYYLYREQFEFFAPTTLPISTSFPAGEFKYDEFFDRELEVYYDQLTLELQLDNPAEQTRLLVRFQGCADAGYCYPPEWLGFELLPSLGSAGNLGLVDAPDLTPSGIAPATPPEDNAQGLPATLLLGFFAGLALLGGAVWFSIRKAEPRR